MLHSQSMYSYLCVGEDTDSCNKNISVKRERRWRVAEKMRESALVWTGTAVTLGTCSWSFDFPISVFLSVVQGGCETRGSDCVWGAKSPPSRTSYKEPLCSCPNRLTPHHPLPVVQRTGQSSQHTRPKRQHLKQQKMLKVMLFFFCGYRIMPLKENVIWHKLLQLIWLICSFRISVAHNSGEWHK